MSWEGLNPPYSTIVADPPWSYPRGFANGPSGARQWSDRNPLPYSSMPVAEVCALPVAELVGDGAYLFLWTTNRYLGDAFRVVESWGFDYRQTLIWHKGDASPFPGAVAPNSAEFVLVGRCGHVARTGTSASSVIAANRGDHSAKPPAIYDLIESVSPAPYVELFARQPRLGWDSWGLGYELADQVREAR